jgi:hypothetical protein
METIRDTIAFATIKSEHNLVTLLGTGDPCDGHCCSVIA